MSDLKISRIEANDIGVTVYFQGFEEPFEVEEFTEGSPTRVRLEQIETLVVSPITANDEEGGIAA